MRFYGKGAEIVGESMRRLGVHTVFGFPHPPVSELYEFFARNGSFRPALSLQEAAYGCLGLEIGGERSFVVTSGTAIFEVMEALSYATAFEVPLALIHVGTAIPGFGNPYPYQGELDLLAAGDFPPLVVAPGTLEEIPLLLSRMRGLAETYRMPAVFYLDSALFHMTGEVEVNEEENVSRYHTAGFREEKRRVVTSVRLDVKGMEKTALLLLEKRKMLAQEAQADFYLTEDAQAVLVAYGACALIGRKVVDRLRAAGSKIGMVRPLTLSPFPDMRGLRRAVKRMFPIEMSTGQLAKQLSCLHPTREIIPFSTYGGLLPEEDLLVRQIGEVLS